MIIDNDENQLYVYGCNATRNSCCTKMHFHFLRICPKLWAGCFHILHNNVENRWWMGEQDVFHLQPANCIHDPLKVTPAQVFKAENSQQILFMSLVTGHTWQSHVQGKWASFSWDFVKQYLWWPWGVWSVKQLPLCLNCLPPVSRGQIFRAISSVWVIIASVAVLSLFSGSLLRYIVVGEDWIWIQEQSAVFQETLILGLS